MITLLHSTSIIFITVEIASCKITADVVETTAEINWTFVAFESGVSQTILFCDASYLCDTVNYPTLLPYCPRCPTHNSFLHESIVN